MTVRAIRFFGDPVLRTVAEPIRAIAEIHEDNVAGIQRRRHGIAFDANDR